jgi:hypothetical protein
VYVCQKLPLDVRHVLTYFVDRAANHRAGIGTNREALVWFKHRAWIPIAWLLSLANVGAVWFAAQPAEPWHATAHAVLGVLFGLGAQRLSARRQALKTGGVGADRPADLATIRAEVAELREGQYETMKRLEQGVEAIAIELERVGEGQRFLTKVLGEPHRNLESEPRAPQAEPRPALRRPPPDEEL